MRALEFWKLVAEDKSNLLERLIAILGEHDIRYCVTGDQAVNAYVEPVVTRDLDLVVAAEQINQLESLLSGAFRVERFLYSLNVLSPDSKLRVQIQTNPRYVDFIKRASSREVLGLTLPVACFDDVIKSKIWAAQDASRPVSKRQKDLLDIERLLEAYPDLRSQVPQDILSRLI